MGGRRVLPRDLPDYDHRALPDLLQELAGRNRQRVEALKPMIIYALQQEDERERQRFFALFRVKATSKRH